MTDPLSVIAAKQDRISVIVADAAEAKAGQASMQSVRLAEAAAIREVIDGDTVADVRNVAVPSERV